MRATIKLTEEEVKEIILKHLKDKAISADSVEIKCKKEYEDRPAGSSRAVFDSIEVSIVI